MAGMINEANNLISVRQGDSFNILVCVKRSCEPIDLTDSVVRMQVRDREDNNLIFEVVATPIDVLNGNVMLQITPEMSQKPVGTYKTDIQVTMADGSVHTIFPSQVNKIGTFRITEQVTHE